MISPSRYSLSVNGRSPWLTQLARAAVLCTAGLATWASAALGLDVEIIPPNPQLGDTITVWVETDSPNEPAPVVTMGDRSYPTFPMGGTSFRALLPTTPLDSPGRVEIRVNGETDIRNLAVWLSDRSFPTQSIWVSSDLNTLGTDYEFDRVDEFKQRVTPERFWDGPFLRPSQGAVSTIYGVQRYYNGVFADDYYHRGVDYAAGYGTPVIAPAAGQVVLVDYEANGFEIHGNTIGLDHGQGVLSIFLHLSDITVQAGQRVEAGQAIGTVGSSGISTGPHLHWGLYVHGTAVDPVPWRNMAIE